MSQTSRKVLGSLTQDYLWIRSLANQKESNLTDKLNTVAKEFQAAATTEGAVKAASLRNARTKEWNKAVTHLTDIASEQLAETTLQNTKQHIFS